MNNSNHKLNKKISYDKSKDQIYEIQLEDLRKNPYQPRNHFEENALNDLKISIIQHGVLQPIVVRKTIKGYDIIVGERRYRASKLAGKSTIPAIIKSLSDEEMLELAIVENLQRENLKPIEEAKSYATMMTELNLKQQEIATRLGKSRSYIANVLRLLNLPPSIKKLIDEERISGAHGRTLLALDNKQDIEAVAKKVLNEGMSVRKLEEYIKKLNHSKKEEKQIEEKPLFLLKHEKQLKEKYGTKIEISKTKKSGKITFEFNSRVEYERILKDLLEE